MNGALHWVHWVELTHATQFVGHVAHEPTALGVKPLAAQVTQIEADEHVPQVELHARHWPLKANVPGGHEATHAVVAVKKKLELHVLHVLPAHEAQLFGHAVHTPATTLVADGHVDTQAPADKKVGLLQAVQAVADVQALQPEEQAAHEPPEEKVPVGQPDTMVLLATSTGTSLGSKDAKVAVASALLFGTVTAPRVKVSVE